MGRKIWLNSMENAASLENERFKSVRDAKATEESDRIKIMAEIGDDVTKVDYAIRDLLQNGASSERLRQLNQQDAISPTNIGARGALQSGGGTATAAVLLWMLNAIWVIAPFVKHSDQEQSHWAFVAFSLGALGASLVAAWCVPLYVCCRNFDRIHKAFSRRALFESAAWATCLLLISQGLLLCTGKRGEKGVPLQQKWAIQAQGISWGSIAIFFAVRASWISHRGPDAEDLLAMGVQAGEQAGGAVRRILISRSSTRDGLSQAMNPHDEDPER